MSIVQDRRVVVLSLFDEPPLLLAALRELSPRDLDRTILREMDRAFYDGPIQLEIGRAFGVNDIPLVVMGDVLKPPTLEDVFRTLRDERDVLCMLTLREERRPGRRRGETPRLVQRWLSETAGDKGSVVHVLKKGRTKGTRRSRIRVKKNGKSSSNVPD